ncbi:MAG: hypothetical protein MJA27_13445 [Pseudanabaenales cyanobacterium]|nr:hypothetical protein [Pseudanabaenales cyanobacterium]
MVNAQINGNDKLGDIEHGLMSLKVLELLIARTLERETLMVNAGGQKQDASGGSRHAQTDSGHLRYA